jgi:hypothetical protein
MTGERPLGRGGSLLVVWVVLGWATPRGGRRLAALACVDGTRVPDAHDAALATVV